MAFFKKKMPDTEIVLLICGRVNDVKTKSCGPGTGRRLSFYNKKGGKSMLKSISVHIYYSNFRDSASMYKIVINVWKTVRKFVNI
jgi:hypothetical protein